MLCWGGLMAARGTIFRAKARFSWLTATIEQSSPICPGGHRTLLLKSLISAKVPGTGDGGRGPTPSACQRAAAAAVTTHRP